MTAAWLMVAAGWACAAALGVELRRRARLIADAGHELRAPLTAVALGLETLRRQPVARRRAEALLAELGRAEAAAADVSAAARGRRAPAREETLRLGRLVERSGEAWGPVAARRGGGVRFEWPLEAVSVRADRRRMAQAFGNLLANAVEHGGGDVVVRGRRVPGAIRVEVADAGRPLPGAGAVAEDGPGERAATEDRAGVRAVALGGPPARAAAGRGRGLVIAERAVREAGGRLEAHDLPGGGRVAVAELPLARGE